jgi:hypothetical protein
MHAWDVESECGAVDQSRGVFQDVEEARVPVVKNEERADKRRAALLWQQLCKRPSTPAGQTDAIISEQPTLRTSTPGSCIRMCGAWQDYWI